MRFSLAWRACVCVLDQPSCTYRRATIEEAIARMPRPQRRPHRGSRSLRRHRILPRTAMAPPHLVTTTVMTTPAASPTSPCQRSGLCLDIDYGLSCVSQPGMHSHVPLSKFRQISRRTCSQVLEVQGAHACDRVGLRVLRLEKPHIVVWK